MFGIYVAHNEQMVPCTAMSQGSRISLREIPMSIDRAVMMFAGIMVLVSLALAHFYSPYWLWLTVFVGLNLIQASFTRVCPAAIIFRKLGLKSGNVF